MGRVVVRFRFLVAHLAGFAALLRPACAAAAGAWLPRAPAFCAVPLPRELPPQRRPGVRAIGVRRSVPRPRTPGLRAALPLPATAAALLSACFGVATRLLPQMRTRTRGGSAMPARGARTSSTGDEGGGGGGGGGGGPVQMVAKLEEAESATEALWPQKKRGAGTPPAATRVAKRQKSAARGPAGQGGMDVKEEGLGRAKKAGRAKGAAATKGRIVKGEMSDPAANPPPPQAPDSLPGSSPATASAVAWASKGKGKGKKEPAAAGSSPASSPSKKRVSVSDCDSAVVRKLLDTWEPRAVYIRPLKMKLQITVASEDKTAPKPRAFGPWHGGSATPSALGDASEATGLWPVA